MIFCITLFILSLLQDNTGCRQLPTPNPSKGRFKMMLHQSLRDQSRRVVRALDRISTMVILALLSLQAHAQASDPITRLLTKGVDMLTNQWAVNLVRRVGNYGEIFERNLGTGTALGIPRGINQLWNLGGIQYAPPIE